MAGDDRRRTWHDGNAKRRPRSRQRPSWLVDEAPGLSSFIQAVAIQVVLWPMREADLGSLGSLGSFR